MCIHLSFMQFKDIVPCPNTLFANTYQKIIQVASILIGSEVGARHFVAALASKVITIFLFSLFKKNFLYVTKCLMLSTHYSLWIELWNNIYVNLNKNFYDRFSMFKIYFFDYNFFGWMHKFISFMIQKFHVNMRVSAQWLCILKTIVSKPNSLDLFLGQRTNVTTL